ncbi:MAG: Lrp/AsnC family transcriptional regulator [Spirochaetota bacterium]
MDGTPDRQVIRMDQHDKEIMSILQKDGRTTKKEIAKLLSISEGMVRNRIENLIRRGILRIKGLINPDSVEDKQFVYIMIKLSANRDSIEVARAVSQLEPIKSVSVIAGRFDLLAEAYIEMPRLIEFLNKELGSISAVLHVESLIALKTFNKWI